MDQSDHLRQQRHKPMFKIIEPSIVRAHFASKRDASFSSYLQPGHLRNQKQQRRTEDCDQISIFDAAEYFKGVHDDEQKEQATLPRVLDLSSMGKISSVSSIDNGNYRARSFHATPTASSEASWSSRMRLLQANPSGSMGVGVIKIPSPSTSTTTNTTMTKWGRISSKWLIPGRKCPCSGKKSVQVEERIEPKAPRMVDLGRCSSSNGTNYPPSLYSTRQSSPKISPKVFQPRSCPRSRRTSYEEDTALSDGSSDLFEIESSTTSYYNPSINNSIINRFASSSVCRHSLDEETNGGDEMESVAPTECYPPSEVSIDWSVTTAEGFDHSSLANFSVSEVRFAATRREVVNTGRDGKGTENDKRNNKGTGNNAGGLLMSCRCEKAVSVGPGPMKCPGLLEELGIRNPGRHVSGKAKEEGHTAAHVMTYD
ncbi:hypothetical protein Cgig2_019249 [Carnegiea gigantea]|uniref:Uncharacterized protein n=1 Tax=Carnegiea gigantea TaxID=171969 RepID=A0A9Q1JHI7_9CARY|nr:hypothetical protein Cgig2_019249 [Carnegiea gigantea]